MSFAKVFSILVCVDTLMCLTLCLLLTVVETPARKNEPAIACARIMPYVALFGEQAVILWALQNGWTMDQIIALKQKCQPVR